VKQLSLLSQPSEPTTANRWVDTFQVSPSPDLSRRDSLVFQLKRDLIALDGSSASQRAFIEERIARIREELS